MPRRTPVPRRLRHISLRASLVLLALVPTLALTGIWAATTANLLSVGFNLRAENAVNLKVSKPFGDMIQAAAQERTLSAVWLADPNTPRTALDAQRRLMDQAVAETASLPGALKDAPQQTKAAFQPIADAIQALDLTNLRSRIDARSIDAGTATAAFSRVTNAEIIGGVQAFQVDDVSLVIAAQPVGTLFGAREALEQENAILAPAVASERLTPQVRDAFIKQAATRRALVATALSTVGQQYPAQQAELAELVRSPGWKTMEAIEDDIIDGSGGKQSALPASARQWPATIAVVEPPMNTVTEDPIHAYNTRAHARADNLIQQNLIISGAGIVTVLVVGLLSWQVARSLLRRLTGLRRATLELAETRLPDVVDRLNRGERVDVESESPELEYGSDELGQVAQAFNSAQRTALRSAVAMASTRFGYQKAILGMARHGQNLVNRQLSLLDHLERRHQDPDVLEGLFELDSQASQMRRYEENLVIISGGQPGRRWNEPVPVIDVMRSAVSEVADYQRITVHADERLMLAAHAIADLIHLLAELMDNATEFSPPVCPVWVRSEFVGKGLAIEIEDRGLGMTEEEYSEANRRLAEPPQFDVLALGDDLRLGLFVAGHLAIRHKIRITLRPSPFGGTSAVVVLPRELLLENSTAQPPMPAPRTTDTAVADMFPGGYPEEQPAPMRSAEMPTVPVRDPAGITPGAGDHHGAPPLPQRVPQTNLAQELRQAPPPVEAFADTPGPMPPAEQLSRSISAFQRGTLHARDLGAQPAHDPNSATLTKDPR